MSEILRLSELLKKREISSLELTEEYIKKIEEKNQSLNVYVHTDFEKARLAANAADEKLKKGEASPLCGIPMALKDNICSDGDLTTCCSKILTDFRPYYDAAVWEKLKSSGAVMLGKTNMDEFAMGSTSQTSCYGAPKNPVNTEHVTGGSSGGSAAAVCAGMAAYALGSDTGGSVRQPASYCGVVGLKPTYGSVSRYGLIAYGSSLDQIGPLAKSAEDAALIYDEIKGIDKRDNTSIASDGSTFSALTGDVKGLKIGVAQEFFDGINAEVKEAVMNAVKVFEANGAVVEEVSLPVLKEALPVYYIIACAEASSNLGRYDGIRYGYRPERYEDIDDMIYKTRSEGFGSEVKRRIILGTYVLSSGYYDAYYKKACILRNGIIKRFDDIFDKCDILIAPTAPSTAPKLNSNSSPVEMYLSDICTVPVNIAGIPSVSIPCGTDKNGLPIGMQIMSKKLAEDVILNAGYFYERTVKA